MFVYVSLHAFVFKNFETAVLYSKYGKRQREKQTYGTKFPPKTKIAILKKITFDEGNCDFVFEKTVFANGVKK